jgi:broad specificity phosphatase PhoE
VVTRVIIVRHGQSNFNAQKRIQGRSNLSHLTEKGKADAEIVGQSLRNIAFDAIYCSPLQRAQLTAEIIQSQLTQPTPLTSTESLLEVDLPLWENLHKDDVIANFAEDYRTWKNRPQELKMILSKNGVKQEFFPVLALYEQAKQFWQEIIPQNPGKTVLIVAHNGINRALIMSAIGMPPTRYHSIQQSNCCINVLNFAGNLGDPVQLESLNQTAHLGVPIPSLRAEQTPIRLLLVRHGETQWNRESRFQGIRDIPLNENGRQQGQKAADFLQSIPLQFAVSSPMARPKETAEIILQYHPRISLELKPPLEEICHGLWEGLLETEIEASFPGMLQQWKDAPETVQMPEGENLQQVWERAIAAWQEIVRGYSQKDSLQTGIVVAHDAINKVILCHLLGLQPANFWNIKQGNGGVSVIDYPDGAEGMPVLQAINITTHLSGSVIDTTAAGAL